MSLWPSILLTMAMSAPAARVFVAHEWRRLRAGTCGRLCRLHQLAYWRAVCGGAPLAWPELAQSFDREARQRERAAGQFGFRRHCDLMPAHPLQATLHVQDT